MPSTSTTDPPNNLKTLMTNPAGGTLPATNMADLVRLYITYKTLNAEHFAANNDKFIDLPKYGMKKIDKLQKAA